MLKWLQIIFPSPSLSMHTHIIGSQIVNLQDNFSTVNIVLNHKIQTQWQTASIMSYRWGYIVNNVILMWVDKTT